MDNYALVIDISSDEENQRYNTPIKTLPLNMVGKLNLSVSSVQVWIGSEADFNSPATSISSFESEASPCKWEIANSEPNDNGESFLVETNKEDSTSSDFEEPESPRTMPHLHPAPTLRDITNECPTSYVPPTKVNKLNDLSEDEPSVAEIEEVWGINIKNSPTD